MGDVRDGSVSSSEGVLLIFQRRYVAIVNKVLLLWLMKYKFLEKGDLDPLFRYWIPVIWLICLKNYADRYRTT